MKGFGVKGRGGSKADGAAKPSGSSPARPVRARDAGRPARIKRRRETAPWERCTMSFSEIAPPSWACSPAAIGVADTVPYVRDILRGTDAPARTPGLDVADLSGRR